ncbi:nucleolar protein [Vigna angularis]|uniref:Nucleolar protein n=1 Tax=Phaseolus angularis TaxID=3914 RepID=A0A8T0LD12_PHAAN|nr:nucleolar protein [Vigna angularis]
MMNEGIKPGVWERSRLEATLLSVSSRVRLGHEVKLVTPGGLGFSLGSGVKLKSWSLHGKRLRPEAWMGEWKISWLNLGDLVGPTAFSKLGFHSLFELLTLHLAKFSLDPLKNLSLSTRSTTSIDPFDNLHRRSTSSVVGGPFEGYFFMELMSGVKNQLTELIPGLAVQDMTSMSLGLSHSLSIYKLKFNADKAQFSHMQIAPFSADIIGYHPAYFGLGTPGFVSPQAAGYGFQPHVDTMIVKGIGLLHLWLLMVSIEAQQPTDL